MDEQYMSLFIEAEKELYAYHILQDVLGYALAGETPRIAQRMMESQRRHDQLVREWQELQESKEVL